MSRFMQAMIERPTIILKTCPHDAIVTSLLLGWIECDIAIHFNQ